MRFGEHEDHYLDTMTDLRWSKENFGPMTWDEAIKAPIGWRLPTLEELLSIVNYSKLDPATDLSVMLASCYWTSTTGVYVSGYAWEVDFFYGNDDYDNNSSVYHVRYIKEDKNAI